MICISYIHIQIERQRKRDRDGEEQKQTKGKDLRHSYVSNSLKSFWPHGSSLESVPFYLHVTYLQFSSVQSFSRVRLFVTPWTAAHQASLSITNSQSLPKLMSIESVNPSNHLILCHPLLLLPSIFPSIRVFTNESALRITWSKYWSFSFNISPSKEHPGLISFRTDWLDLFAVQGTLESLFQHHSSKASILWHSGFFIVQLSHPYLTTGKTIALTRRAFVGKVMSLLCLGWLYYLPNNLSQVVQISLIFSTPILFILPKIKFRPSKFLISTIVAQLPNCPYYCQIFLLSALPVHTPHSPEKSLEHCKDLHYLQAPQVLPSLFKFLQAPAPYH